VVSVIPEKSKECFPLLDKDLYARGCFWGRGICAPFRKVYAKAKKRNVVNRKLLASGVKCSKKEKIYHFKLIWSYV